MPPCQQDIIRKLTSRKLWLAVAAFVSGLVVAFDGDAETAETVSGLILQGASVVGYLIAEGLADSANAESNEAFKTPQPREDTEGSTFAPGLQGDTESE